MNLLDATAVNARKTLYGECFTHDAVDLDRPASGLRWRWVIDGDWKLIVPAPQNEPDAPVELFKIIADPFEKENVAAQNPERVAELRAKLDAWWDGK